MNTASQALEYWVATPAAHALGWTLVHFLWQGAVVAAVLAAALWTVDSRSSRLRYGLAAGALALLPLCFALTFALLAAGLNSAAMPGRQAFPPALAPYGIPSQPFRLSAIDPLSWLGPLWLLGVLACYGRSLAGWIGVARLRRIGVCAAPAQWQQKLRDLAAELRVARPVRLLESCLTEVPVVVGVLRPVILAPVGMLAGLPANQLEAILIHELAHVRRWDYAVNLAQNLVEGLLFYHPAVWWISRVIRAERENCCDDMVVALRPDTRTYAAALAHLEIGRHAGAETALAASGGNLMKRICRLLQPPAPRHRGAAPMLSIVLLIVTVAMVAAWAPQQQAPPSPSPYARWVGQDVAYIITNQEREAFRNLQTDAEREHFIEQFWLRRDPTPGTAANEYKEEHYRRIAYANQRFGATDLDGWSTDRGRIYIVYGPPDEIEAHPAAGAGPAYQEWLYHLINGIGKNVVIRFEDQNANGEYRMTMDPHQPTLALPGQPSQYLRLGDTELRNGALDAALAQYRAGMAADPGNLVAYQKRIIEVLMRQGKGDEAAALNQQILNANPRDTDAQGLHAALRLQKGDIAGATTELLAAIGSDPQNAVLRLDLGLAYAAAGQAAQARQEMLTSVDLRPDFARARLELAKLDAQAAQAGATPKEFRSADGNPQIVVQVYPNRKVVTFVTFNPRIGPTNLSMLVTAAGRNLISHQDTVSGYLYQTSDTLEPGAFNLSVMSIETATGVHRANVVNFVVE